MNPLQRITRWLAHVGPATRWYRPRAALLRRSGYDIHESARITDSVRILGPRVSVGERTFLGHELLITGSNDSRVDIGSDVDVGPRCSFITGTHRIGTHGHRAGEGLGLDIKIGNGTWVGAACTVLGGASIGAGCVVAAGTVVPEGDYPNDVLLGGVPARTIRSLVDRPDQS